MFGMCAEDMDAPVQLAFRELVAQAVTDMMTDDVILTEIVNIVCGTDRRLSTSLAAFLERRV